MPLLIPGLDEAAAKTLSKRLQKLLKAHPGTPTLRQTQTILAQALGHADWHAAQQHWASRPEPERPVDRWDRADVGRALEDAYRALFVECMALLEKARTGSRGSLDTLGRKVHEIKGLAGVAGALVVRQACHAVEVHLELMGTDVLFQSDRALGDLETLLWRVDGQMEDWLYPGVLPTLRGEAQGPANGRLLRLVAVRLAMGDLSPNTPLENEEATADRAQRATETLFGAWNKRQGSAASMANAACLGLVDGPGRRVVWLGDSALPSWPVGALVDAGCFTLFEEPGQPAVVVLFLHRPKTSLPAELQSHAGVTLANGKPLPLPGVAGLDRGDRLARAFDMLAFVQTQPAGARTVRALTRILEAVAPPPTVLLNRPPARLSDPGIRDDVRAKVKEVTKTPESAHAYLRSTGIVTAKGRLTKRYGG